MNPVERVVDVRGLFGTAVLEAGEGEPLLYLHGAAGHTGWALFLDALAEQFRVIAPWHPGYGRSSGIDQIDDVLDMVVYYQDLLDALEIDSVHVVGHDLGGMFAAELAALGGLRVRSLSLTGALGLWMEGDPVPDFFTMSPQEYLEATWHDPQSVRAATHRIDLGDNAAVLGAMLERAQSLGTAGKFLWPIPDRGLSKRLHRITAPTLLIWGDDDCLVDSAYARTFATAIPHSSLVTIPESGHVPMLEQPDAFVDAIGRFVQSVVSGEATVAP